MVDGEEGIAQQGEGADEVGVTTAGVVFTEASVLAPVKAVFDASPVIAHEAYPLLREVGVIEAVSDPPTRGR